MLASSSVTQRIDDQSERRRGLASAWIPEVISRPGWAPVFEHPLETTFGNVRLRQTFRHVRQAQSGQRSIQHLVVRVVGELTFDTDPQVASAFLKLPSIQSTMGQTKRDA